MSALEPFQLVLSDDPDNPADPCWRLQRQGVDLSITSAEGADAQWARRWASARIQQLTGRCVIWQSADGIEHTSEDIT